MSEWHVDEAGNVMEGDVELNEVEIVMRRNGLYRLVDEIFRSPEIHLLQPKHAQEIIYALGLKPRPPDD